MTQVHTAYIHHNVMQRFDVLITRERLAHAYLFVGSKGVGKKETAIELAKFVNCEERSEARPCGRCASCLKIDSHNHPDIHIINPEDNASIKIDDVRDVIQQTRLRPYEAYKKIFIICDVERMTIEAGNALLKTLEEPSANSLIILTTSSLESNLDTIRSPCQMVFFPRMPVNELAQTLQSDYDIEHSQALFLARFSEGSLGRAVGFSSSKMIDFKNRVIDQFVLQSDSSDYIKKISSDRDDTKKALDVLWSFFRDVLMHRIGEETQHLIHQDRVSDIRRFADRYEVDDVVDILREIAKTLRLVKDNFNVKIGLSLIKEMM